MSKKIKSIRIIDPGTSPDVDSDFHTVGRKKTIEYVVNKYGKDNVATIYTPGPFKVKNSFKSMATIYDLPFSVSNKISSTLPDSTSKTTITELLEETNDEGREFRKLLINEKLKEIAESASQIEGRMRETGTHACGMVISNHNLYETIPTEVRQEDGLTVTQWNYYNCEDLGLIKMDFLGLDTIDLIHQATSFVNEREDVNLDIDKLIDGELTDKKTFELFQRADTSGIFQFASSGVREMLLKVKPDTFDDLPAITALYRPGPMSMNAHNEFADRKQNPDLRIPVDPKFIGTDVEDVLRETNGLCVYQEQVMSLSKRCAGFSSREADTLRKGIGKKKQDLIDSMGDKFIKGMIANGYDPEAVHKLWDGIVGFGAYSFNKSHSVSYALLAYQSAYLKANYPVEFMAAYAKQRQGDPKTFNMALSEIRKMKIKLQPASVNASLSYIRPDKESKNCIVYGLGAIKNLSQDIADKIIQEREKNGLYKNLSDFVNRMVPHGITKNQIIILAKVGAFDTFKVSRKAVVENADKLFIKTRKKAEKKKRPSLFGDIIQDNPTIIDLPEEDYSYSESAKIEADLTGFFLSHNPLDKLKQPRDYDLSDLSLTEEITFYGTFSNLETKTTKSKFKMLLGTVDNQISQQEFKFSNQLYKSIQKYNLLENVIKEYDGIDNVENIDYHKDKIAILKQGAKLEKLSTKEEIKEWLDLVPIKLPVTNIVYKITLGYTNAKNYLSSNDFGRIEILNIEEVPLSQTGKLVYIIHGRDKRKEKDYINKLKEVKGKDTIRIVYMDKTFTEVDNVKFMKGTTQADILNI